MTARCPCGGSDDYCVCQNVDLAALREQQKETAKDTYFAIAEYKTRIDWFEGELAKADEWKAQCRALEAKVAALTAERDEARHHYDCVVVSWAECRQKPRLRKATGAAMSGSYDPEGDAGMPAVQEQFRDGARSPLVEALRDATAHLVGAASAYRKHAARHRSVGRAATDPFFTTRAADFERAAKRAQAALKALTADLEKPE